MSTDTVLSPKGRHIRVNGLAYKKYYAEGWAMYPDKPAVSALSTHTTSMRECPLSDDLIYNIMDRTDVETVARVAATCKYLNRAIKLTGAKKCDAIKKQYATRTVAEQLAVLSTTSGTSGTHYAIYWLRSQGAKLTDDIVRGFDYKILNIFIRSGDLQAVKRIMEAPDTPTRYYVNECIIRAIQHDNMDILAYGYIDHYCRYYISSYYSILTYLYKCINYDRVSMAWYILHHANTTLSLPDLRWMICQFCIRAVHKSSISMVKLAITNLIPYLRVSSVTNALPGTEIRRLHTLYGKAAKRPDPDVLQYMAGILPLAPNYGKLRTILDKTGKTDTATYRYIASME